MRSPNREKNQPSDPAEAKQGKKSSSAAQQLRTPPYKKFFFFIKIFFKNRTLEKKNINNVNIN